MVTVRQEAQPRRRWRKKRERLRDEVAGDRIFAIELLISYRSEDLLRPGEE
jgi:hypothetical protein